MNTTSTEKIEAERFNQQPVSRTTGFARPGALQMLIAGVALTLEALAPLLLAAAHRQHEWDIMFTGWPAFSIMAATVVLGIFYFVGFLRYCASKGYSTWLGFWLFLGNVAGFVVLLLLPDIAK